MIALPGWTCPLCHGFNGSAKSFRQDCRGCGAAYDPPEVCVIPGCRERATYRFGWMGQPERGCCNDHKSVVQDAIHLIGVSGDVGLDPISGRHPEDDVPTVREVPDDG